MNVVYAHKSYRHDIDTFVKSYKSINRKSDQYYVLPIIYLYSIMATSKKETNRTKKKATFVVFTDTKRKMDYISMMEQKDLSDLADEGFNVIIDRYEKKNGKIPVKIINQ